VFFAQHSDLKNGMISWTLNPHQACIAKQLLQPDHYYLPKSVILLPRESQQQESHPSQKLQEGILQQ